MHVIVGACVAVAAGCWWVWDVWRRPYKRHRPCGGTGRVRVRGNRYGLCTCDGKPKKLRIGAQWVRPKLRRK